MNDVTPVPVEKSRAIAPFRAFAAEPFSWLRNEIERLFDDFERPAVGRVFNWLPRNIDLLPALDLIDDGKNYRLSVELPGLTEKDIEIGIADGVLTVSGEKKEEKEHEEKGVLLSERRYGSFQRQVSVPRDVDPEKIKAQFKDGILTVTLARDENSPSRTRKIAIEKSL